MVEIMTIKQKVTGVYYSFIIMMMIIMQDLRGDGADGVAGHSHGHCICMPGVPVVRYS